MNISVIKCNQDVEEFLIHSNRLAKEKSDLALTNAKMAWMFACIGRHHVNIKYIQNIHKILLENEDRKHAGKFRRTENRKDIYIKISIWLKRYNKLQGGKVCRDKNAYQDFKRISPFDRGNGRVGRILYNIYRLNCNLSLEKYV